MATSLKTTNYGFGKYAADDVTSYLTDYNETMDKLDSTIKSVQDIADEAKATSDTNLNNIASLTQGLTATNKNVENLGKTQTVQQTEIDSIEERISKIGETDTIQIKAIASMPLASGTKELYLQKIKGVAKCNCYLDANSGSHIYNDVLSSGLYGHRLGEIEGNPLSLDNTVSYGIVIRIKGSDNTLTGFDAGYIAYRSEVNKTVIGLASNQSTFVLANNEIAAIII